MKQVLFFWFCIMYSILSGQNGFIKFYELNNIIFHFHDVAIVGDSYIVTGVGWDTLITPERQTFFNAKMDKSGSLLDFSYYDDGDSSEYGISTSGSAYIPCIIAMNDTAFIVTYSNFSKRVLELFLYNKELYLQKKCYIQNEPKNMNVFPKQLKYLNGSIYLAGTEYDFNKKIYESYLFKLTSSLDIVWKKRIPNIEKVRSFEYNVLSNEFIFSQYEGQDRIVVTDTMLIQKKEIEKDVSIEKVIFHNLKSIEKDQVLLSNSDVFGNDIIGYKFSKNISCFNKDFDRIWTFNMGGIPDQRSAVTTIIPSSDDAYFAYGQIGARVADIRDLYPSSDSVDIRILSTVKFREDGKILWQRFDTLEAHYYIASEAFSGGISACADGGAVVTGDVRWFDTIRVDGVLKIKPGYKHFLMKIDSNGCVDGLHCNVEPKTETVLSVQPSFPSDAGKMTVYPNPTTGIVTVDPGMAVTKGILTVYNVLGEVVTIRSLAGDEQGIQLGLSGQPSGQYYITIRREDGKMAKASFIIHR